MATSDILKSGTDKEPESQQLPDKTLETPPAEDEAKPSTTAEAAAAMASESGSALDLQKRIRRAERFGMPVQLSEEEKRNSRAGRFGTASNGLKESEEQKRKTRAERFGLSVQSVSDEEAKKKARLARFNPVSKISSAEEDKRKARAARFSETPSADASQVNNSTNSEKEKENVGEEGQGGT